MVRLRYADLYSPDIKPLVDQINAERGSMRHLYQMLLHRHPAAQE